MSRNNFDADIDGPPGMLGGSSADNPANNTIASHIEVTQNSIATDGAATHK